MPILIKRSFPASEPVAKSDYTFQLNKEETKKFFDEFLKDFFDQSLLGDLELRDCKVEFSMKLFKKEPEISEDENINID
jgi:hypothetical protein